MVSLRIACRNGAKARLAGHMFLQVLLWGWSWLGTAWNHIHGKESRAATWHGIAWNHMDRTWNRIAWKNMESDQWGHMDPLAEGRPTPSRIQNLTQKQIKHIHQIRFIFLFHADVPGLGSIPERSDA